MTVGAVAAAPVARGPGIGARALGPDHQRAAGVEPGDRAAAGADRVDRERGQPDRVARRPRASAPARARRPAPGTRRCSCRPCRTRPRRRSRTPSATAAAARTPAGRARQQQRAGCSAASAERHEPAGRRHHQHLVARASRARRRYARHTGRSAASATVVTMRSYSRNSGDTSCEHTTSSPCARERRGDRSLVGRVEVGVQQAHRDRVDVVESCGQRAPSNGSSSRPCASSRPPTSNRSSRGTSGAGGRRTGRRATGGLPRDLDHVGEAAGRHQRDAAEACAPAARWSPPSCRARARRARDGDRAIASTTATRGIVGVDGTLTTAAVVGDDVGERPAGVDARLAHAGTTRRYDARSSRRRSAVATASRRRWLDRLEEVPAGADRADLEPEGRDAAAEPQHVHVERVPGRAPARPRPAHERVPPDHRAEPVDQRGRERPLDRRQRDPAAPVAEQAVVVDRRRRPRCARPATPASRPATRRSSSAAGSRIQSSSGSTGSGAARSSPTRRRRGAPAARSRSSRSVSSGQRTSTTSVICAPYGRFVTARLRRSECRLAW